MTDQDWRKGVGAAEALAWADRLGETVRTRNRWLARVLLAFALVTLGALAVPAFVSGIWAGVIFAAIFGGFGAVIALTAGRTPGSTPRIRQRHAVAIAAWALLYFVAVSGGVIWFPDDPAWWLPGAVVVSLPLFIGAYLENRQVPKEDR